MRLYAEDPAAGLAAAERPAAPARRARRHHRVRGRRRRRPACGWTPAWRTGRSSSTHYDPMLAKVISWAPTRAQAALSLARALQHARVHGVTTNRDLLVNVLRHEAFLAGDTDTAFFDRHGLDTLAAPAGRPPRGVRAGRGTRAGSGGHVGGARCSPASRPGGATSRARPQSITLGDHEVRYRLTRAGLDHDVSDPGRDARRRSARPGRARRRRRAARPSTSRGTATTCSSTAPDGGVRLPIAPRFVDPAEQVAPGSLVAPMPGLGRADRGR